MARVIKAEWEFEGKTYQIRSNVKRNSKYLISMEEFIRRIEFHDREFLIRIRDCKIKKDPFHILKITRKNILKGEIIGTKEAILRKFLKIKVYLTDVNKIKEKILDNTYISIIESCQSLLIFHKHIVLVPRLIPDYLRKLPKDVKNSVSIKYLRELIKLCKEIEHKKAVIPSGRKLDEYMDKAKVLNNRIEEIL